MSARKSVSVEGFHHGSQPIPAACVKGNILCTGGVHGMDPKTQALPDDLKEQVEHMFANLERIVVAGGGDLGSIIKITVWTKTMEARGLVNEAWLRLFPDAASRPARHTHANPDLPANMLVQCDAIAVIS